MSQSRRIRRLRGDHKRRVPPDAAALVFQREGDDFVVRMLTPAGMDERKPHEVAQLAAACAQYARELLEGETDEPTTTGAESVREGEHDEQG